MKVMQLQSYKHNKEIHRLWKKTYLLHEDDEKIVVANNKTRVVEANGRFWSTREPAICIFYKKKWFNIIGMLKKDGIYYYCNIASPAVVDEEALKYIDYDLDLRVRPDFIYKILDRNEYERHKIKMNYPEEIQNILEDSLKELISMAEKKEGPFQHKVINDWYTKFKKENSR